MAGETAPERDPETVALFVEESLDGLARVEKLLLDAERGQVSPDLVATVFREVHTIKGTSGFLDLAKTQALAHATEDLLACLRDGSLTARPWHYTCLVEAGDVLRRLVEHVHKTNEEGDVDVAPLVARLQARGDAPPAPTTKADAAEAAEPAGADEAAADDTLRVNVELLDGLMDLIGELVLARNQIARTLDARVELGETEHAASRRLDAVTTRLQEQVMKTRMQPVARVFDKVPRLVRDLAKATGKLVSAHVAGAGAEIDKALVEALRDPVMHIVRNAIDHGIEAPAERVARGKPATGRLAVRAFHEAGVVTIEIEDDGRGMDPAALRRHAVERGVLGAREAEALGDAQALELVFRPGFSTAARVTAISGRGVGMDVVRTHVEGAGGQVELDSTPAKGTTIRLKMPLSLAIIPVLLVSAGGQRFAIPQASLVELLFLDEVESRDRVESVRGAPIVRLRGDVLPLVRLDATLALPATASGEGTTIAVVAAGDRRYGLVVDAIADTEEIVVKPLAGSLQRLGCYTGAAVLGDGGVALILDVKGVAARAGVAVGAARRVEARDLEEARGQPRAAVVFRAGAGVQCVVPLSMVTRLDRVATSSIERLGDSEVIQVRGAVLPIVRPEAVVPIGARAADAEQSLIVFELGQLVALAVGDILDVVELPPEATSLSDDTPFTLGKTVVFGRTTLVLDVYRIVRELAPQFISDRRKAARALRVVVADARAAMRGALAGYLRSLGVEVFEAEGGDAALREVRAARAGRVDAVVADPSLEAGGADVLATLARERPGLPVFGWIEDGDEGAARDALARGAKACVSRLHREDLVVAFEKHGLGFRRAEDRGDARGERRVA